MKINMDLWTMQAFGAMILIGISFYLLRQFTDRGGSIYHFLFWNSVYHVMFTLTILLLEGQKTSSRIMFVLMAMVCLTILVTIGLAELKLFAVPRVAVLPMGISICCMITGNLLAYSAQAKAPNPSYVWGIVGMNLIVILTIYLIFERVTIPASKWAAMVCAAAAVALFSFL